MPRRDGWAIAGLVAFFGLLFVALFGERVAPYEPIYFVVEHGKDPRPYDPGLVFPFGSDVLGRDMFSIVLAGARATLTIVLLAGLARVAAGVAIAAAASAIRPLRVLTETVADLAAAIPATLVAVLLIQAFVRGDTSIPIVISALLLVGWAGPYRVIRAETDRLASAPFTDGARVLGVGRFRLFWRHHLPHLAPVIATNLSQQVVAALVLLAELGVLGVIASTVRNIDVTESLSVVRTGPPNQAAIPDSNEWGAMLSSARTVEILWVTRWVIFVPGAAFAFTAAAVAIIGYALARRYARRDVFADLRGAGVLAVTGVALVVLSMVVPERYAQARSWATDARAAIEHVSDTASAFADAGLATQTVTRSKTIVTRSGPATLTVGSRTVSEEFPEPRILVKPLGGELPTGPQPEIHVRSLVTLDVGGGGTVEAPLVFAGRGIARPAVLKPPVVYFSGRPVLDLNTLIKDYPDDYANIDVHGKVVLLVRFAGVDTGARGIAPGFTGTQAITEAIARGAAGVVMVDPDVGLANSTNDPRASRALPNPYASVELEFPPASDSGVPVIVVDPPTGASLFGSFGIDLARLLQLDKVVPARSESRDLGVTARLDVPLRADTTSISSLIGEVPGFDDDTGRIVVWMDHGRDTPVIDAARRDVLATLAKFGAARHVPFTFVDFDPRLDARAVRDYLVQRRILVVFLLDQLDRTTMRFTTANGDLIPALDLYADKAGTKHERTTRTLPVDAVGSPVPDMKSVVITTGGPQADARSDVLALIGYAAGRWKLGAPELGR